MGPSLANFSVRSQTESRRGIPLRADVPSGSAGHREVGRRCGTPGRLNPERERGVTGPRLANFGALSWSRVTEWSTGPGTVTNTGIAIPRFIVMLSLVLARRRHDDDRDLMDT